MYNNLFCLLVEHSSHEDKWEYDPLDSKYPAIDGILRRERKEAESQDGRPRYRLPEFALIQLKGTRFIEGEDPWPELKRAFSRRRNGKPNSIDQIDAIKESCSALLVGLSVNAQSKEIEAAYIGAPTGYPAGRKPETRIPREDLLTNIVSVLNSLRPVENERPVLQPDLLVRGGLEPTMPIVHSVIFPRQKEIVYFNKQQDGMVSIGEKGMIFGRNIMINWTIPRGITTISIHRVSGSPVITLEPVALPRPPYQTYPTSPPPQNLTDGEWSVNMPLPNINSNELWWVLQIRFENCEATVSVEART